MSAMDSDDSDEWGTEELTLPAPKANVANENNDNYAKDGNKDDDDDYWATQGATPAKPDATTNSSQEPKKPTPSTASSPSALDDRPMMIVDMTQMTNETIHSKFDRNSVNDAEAASALRKKIEHDYSAYAKDASLLQNGTVIPCGMSVWKGALSRLRDERPGHYFAPIFPPPKDT